MSRTADDEWISSRTGVRQRRLAEPGVGSSDLAITAGRAAIDDAGLLSNQVDALITATMIPISFSYGLDLADALISSNAPTRSSSSGPTFMRCP